MKRFGLDAFRPWNKSAANRELKLSVWESGKTAGTSDLCDVLSFIKGLRIISYNPTASSFFVWHPL